MSTGFASFVDHALKEERYNGQFVEVRRPKLSFGHRFRLFLTIGRRQRPRHAWTGLAPSPVIKAGNGVDSNFSTAADAQTGAGPASIMDHSGSECRVRTVRRM
jgi:hypothetical protein